MNATGLVEYSGFIEDIFFWKQRPAAARSGATESSAEELDRGFEGCK